jgi:hypothetical protein
MAFNIADIDFTNNVLLSAEFVSETILKILNIVACKFLKGITLISLNHLNHQLKDKRFLNEYTSIIVKSLSKLIVCVPLSFLSHTGSTLEIKVSSYSVSFNFVTLLRLKPFPYLTEQSCEGR